MDAAQRAALVAAYVAGPAAIRASLDGIADAQLDARPADGGWTPREVVHHTADSEMTSGIRLRRLIAEDDPLIVGYDGDEFARRLHYADRPIEPALDAIEAARATTAQILAGLTEAEWGRTGTHSEDGPYGVERWLEIYAAHCHEHADQIGSARAEARARS
jgi:predicted transcriptional regulator